MSKKTIVVMAVIWMIVLVAGITASVTLVLCGTFAPEGIKDFRQNVVVTEEEYEQIQRYSRLNELYEIVKNDYYVDIDSEKLILGAIDGMMDVLNDPYSFYCTPDEMAVEKDRQEGTYYGVGLQMLAADDDRLLITRVFAKSPARQAGLMSGDEILSVSGRELTGTSQQKMTTAQELIKGDQGTTVAIKIRRGENEKTFNVVRDMILINRVDFSMLENDIGYIAIYEFMGDDVEGFSEALTTLKNQGVKALVIDLRSNPGGLLDDVVDIADMLLDKGLIVYIENRYGTRESYYSDEGSAGLPLAVLVNGMSASASEILAGVVQDRGAGLIVGETTFGKGIVQTIIPFAEDGAGVHLTTASYFTPSGRSIHGRGIEPDCKILMSDGDEINPEMPDVARDTQLRKAVELLIEQLK